MGSKNNSSCRGQTFPRFNASFFSESSETSGPTSNEPRQRNEGRGDRDRQSRQRGFDSYSSEGGGGPSRNNNNNRRRRGRNRNRGERNADYDRQVEAAAAEFEGEPVLVEGIFEQRDEGLGNCHCSKEVDLKETFNFIQGIFRS